MSNPNQEQVPKQQLQTSSSQQFRDQTTSTETPVLKNPTLQASIGAQIAGSTTDETDAETEREKENERER
ncbi:hypothetical protein CHS0354_026955, partial [Potamilus streckersoni]